MLFPKRTSIRLFVLGFFFEYRDQVFVCKKDLSCNNHTNIALLDIDERLFTDLACWGHSADNLKKLFCIAASVL